MTVGDGARVIPVTCTPTFCIATFGSPILGNASAVATDTIVLDTLKPTALATQDRTAVPSARVVARVATRIPAGTFRKTLALPARLAPGRYRVALVGPGGTLRATLRLTGAR